MSFSSPGRHGIRGLDVLLLGVLVLLLCGTWLGQRPDGGDGVQPTPVGIDRSGRSVGAIKRFASVIVNGIEYSTDTVVITVDGQPATQADLRVGQIVSVDGLRDPVGTLGIASTIVYRSNVIGPISSVDVGSGTLVVLGQTVRVNADTAVDDAIVAPALQNLSAGDVLAVSGNPASGGRIEATRLERVADTGTYRVSASISDYDEGRGTFTLNDQLVDFSRASVQGFLADDVLVRVVGTLNGGRLRATSVVVDANALLADDGEDMDLEGLVTAVTSSTTFQVSEQPVQIVAGTRFEGGTAASLTPDLQVVVEGSVRGGVLVAESVKIRRISNVRIDGVVRGTSAGGTRLSVEGVTVLVDDLTQFEDNSAIKQSPFGARDIRVGDFVQVAGAGGTAGSVLAHRIERDEPEATTVLRGTITANLGGRLRINGVVVNIDMRTEITNDAGVRMSWNQLIRQARAGDRIKAKCFPVPNGLRAKEIEYSGPAR